MTGQFIVIEGIDQSGKETQARLLARRLRWAGYKTEKLSYPVYTTYSGREIASYLEGRRKYPFQVLHMLYSMNRWESIALMKKQLTDNQYLIADRYSPSNIAYGTARGLDEIWLMNLDRGLPEPDQVMLVDTPVKTSFARKTVNRDIHERDRVFLEKVRRNYLQLARRKHWTVVKGDRPLQEVNDDLWRQVKKSKSQRSTSPSHGRKI